MDSSHLDPPDRATSGGDPPSAGDLKLAEVGSRVRAALSTVLDRRPATSRGWLLAVAGIGGTLLVAVSYLASWLSAVLEHRDGVDVDTMALHEVTTTPLAWMYRIATLGMVGCAVALLYAPRTAARPLRIAGFTAAGLSLYSALIATLVISNVAGALTGAMTVRYGPGLYAGYLGIVALASFIGLSGRGGGRPVVLR
jgi:hypothetical protein